MSTAPKRAATPGQDLVVDGLGLRLAARDILREVRCRIPARRLTVLAGPNGAGKSTLLRCLAGLLVPTRGRVTLADGRDMASLPPAERARLVAYVPQDRIVHWPLTVERVVALGRLPGRGTLAGAGEADRRAIDGALREMDVAGLVGRPITELSGGERARVLIARALAQETPILIADEPAAGLDPAHQIGLLEHLIRLAADGRTVILAMHDLSMAARFAGHVVLLHAGACLAEGGVCDVLSQAHLRAAFGLEAALGVAEGVPFVVPLARIG